MKEPQEFQDFWDDELTGYSALETSGKKNCARRAFAAGRRSAVRDLQTWASAEHADEKIYSGGDHPFIRVVAKCAELQEKTK